jgi:hypothetical protein
MRESVSEKQWLLNQPNMFVLPISTANKFFFDFWAHLAYFMRASRRAEVLFYLSLSFHLLSCEDGQHSSAARQPSAGERKYLYLLQCAQERDTADLESEHSAVLQLVYAPLAGQALSATTFELRNTSWNEGRNALLSRAKSTYQSALPLYFIFMDCDVRLAEVPSTSTSRACMHLFTRPLL